MAARVPVDRSEISPPGCWREASSILFFNAFRTHEHSGRVVATQVGDGGWPRDARKTSPFLPAWQRDVAIVRLSGMLIERKTGKAATFPRTMDSMDRSVAQNRVNERRLRRHDASLVDTLLSPRRVGSHEEEPSGGEIHPRRFTKSFARMHKAKCTMHTKDVHKAR